MYSFLLLVCVCVLFRVSLPIIIRIHHRHYNYFDNKELAHFQYFLKFCPCVHLFLFHGCLSALPSSSPPPPFPLPPIVGLDYDLCWQKMQVLTLISLAAESQEVSFQLLCSELCLDSDKLEQLVLESEAATVTPKVTKIMLCHVFL